VSNDWLRPLTFTRGEALDNVANSLAAHGDARLGRRGKRYIRQPGSRASAIREGGFSARMASYSAGRDVAAKLISALCTGTHLDIAATDQIRPIATTAVIAIIPARICFPLRRVEIGEEGVACFSPLQCEVVHSLERHD
jgi:hypothetical protein